MFIKYLVHAVLLGLPLYMLLSCSACSNSPAPPCVADPGTQAGTLGALAEHRCVRMGTFLFSADGPSGQTNASFKSALREFDMYILPVFLRLIEPNENQFDFAMPDSVADAAPPGTVFYVPGFSNDLLPEWLEKGNYSGEQLRAILINYVRTVTAHFNAKYPGRIIAFEVVLEPLSWNIVPGQGPLGFWHRIGLDAGLDQYEYIRIAFQTARDAAPDAQLYVDDFGTEDLGPKSDVMFNLMSTLKSQGVPIDGVGLEGHFMTASGGTFPLVPPVDQIKLNMDRLASLGLETMITSVDIAIPDSTLSASTLDQQAQGFRTLLHACLSAHDCKGFATWGLGDKDSWIPQFFPGWGSPLLFDLNYQPKPSYYALKQELSE